MLQSHHMLHKMLEPTEEVLEKRVFIVPHFLSNMNKEENYNRHEAASTHNSTSHSKNLF